MQSTESSSDNDDEVETGEMVADESEEYVEVEYEENVPIEEFVVCDKNHAIFSEEMNEEEVDNVEAVHEVIEYVIPFEEVLEEYIIEDESDDEPDDKCTEVYLDHNDEHLQILQVFTVDEPKKFQMNLSPLRPTHKRSLSKSKHLLNRTLVSQRFHCFFFWQGELENIVELKARLKEDVPCHKLQNQTIDEKTFLVSEDEESQDMKNESMEEQIDDYIKSVVWIIYLRRFQSDFSCPVSANFHHEQRWIKSDHIFQSKLDLWDQIEWSHRNDESHHVNASERQLLPVYFQWNLPAVYFGQRFTIAHFEWSFILSSVSDFHWAKEQKYRNE